MAFLLGSVGSGVGVCLGVLHRVHIDPRFERRFEAWLDEARALKIC